MVQGTASNVGKSILVAALCRIFRQEGWNVAPFKAQNMSLNSFVTRDGGEMGRAQVVQAEAACIEPSVDMNPVLLKPETDMRSQVIVRGKPSSTQSARDYYKNREPLWSVVCESLDRLRSEYDIVVIEGAGSPAEINLKENDIVNMRVARSFQAPVILVADIDRGGVFASILGTLELLEPEERALVKAAVINKFRGDVSLLRPGITMIEKRIGIPIAGVVPYFRDIHIADEDSVALEEKRAKQADPDVSGLDIAVIRLPHTSNFDDFDPLQHEEGVRLRYVEAADALETPDLIIIPGTKTTIADLDHLRRTGMADRILELSRQGVPVIGICGGYQMLGETIIDPLRVESPVERVGGLGLLPIATTFYGTKSTHQVKGHVIRNDGLLRGAAGLPVTGYEIHMGQSEGDASGRAFHIEERSRASCDDMDGFQAPEGNVFGTYIHGLFHNQDLRRAILTELARRKGVAMRFGADVLSKEEQYDRLADLVRSSLDMELVFRIAGVEK
ncbi:MAG: cobyric acid synthase [Chloroflexi bacterium]|nr:cobyric acid synthase [Chloroflexota bacterium]